MRRQKGVWAQYDSGTPRMQRLQTTRILLRCRADFFDRHFEHFTCLPISGTGVLPGSRTFAWFTSRSWPQSRQ
jgi:hypothetical protein